MPFPLKPSLRNPPHDRPTIQASPKIVVSDVPSLLAAKKYPIVDASEAKSREMVDGLMGWWWGGIGFRRNFPRTREPNPFEVPPIWGGEYPAKLDRDGRKFKYPYTYFLKNIYSTY
ncbi:hypothetical protein SESBI_01853, partial [Sesbania bispinosa]